MLTTYLVWCLILADVQPTGMVRAHQRVDSGAVAECFSDTLRTRGQGPRLSRTYELETRSRMRSTGAVAGGVRDLPPMFDSFTTDSGDAAAWKDTREPERGGPERAG